MPNDIASVTLINFDGGRMENSFQDCMKTVKQSIVDGNDGTYTISLTVKITPIDEDGMIELKSNVKLAVPPDKRTFFGVMENGELRVKINGSDPRQHEMAFSAEVLDQETGEVKKLG